MATVIETPRRTSTLGDIGLLALRLAVGAVLVQAGLRKFLDFDTTSQFIEEGGWRMPTLATMMVSAAETVGGAMLILGLLTPLAACAVIAAMLDAWAVNVSTAAVWSEPFNHPFTLALAGVALLFVGAGGISVDSWLWGRPWWPAPVTVTLFLVAVGAAVATWMMLNGTNPIHLSTPAG